MPKPRNPFRQRPPFKKRIVNVSLTDEQFEAFTELQRLGGYDSAGALIKTLLAMEWDVRNPKPVEIGRAHV